MSSKWNVLQYYIQYKNRKFKSEEQIKKYQDKRLKKHLRFVTANTEYYKDYHGKSLKEFPIIDKKVMMDNFNRMNTVGIDKEEALAFAIGSERTREFSEKLHNITVGLSSGTSDSRGIFLVSNAEKDQWAGYILSKVLDRGILSKYKIAFFMRANSNLYEAIGSKNIQFEFFDIYADLDNNIQKLEMFQADILVAQPSMLLKLADAINRDVLHIKPEKIISIAEVLEKEDEEYLKKIFDVDVIHQVYQCTEGCLATTCQYGTIHLNEDVVHIEKVYLDKQRFIPIVTDLERKSQPIIRYRLNDVLVEKMETCPCGCQFTALEKIEGREDDVFQFVTRDGKPIYVFPDFIRRCILFAGNITNYRVLQKEDGSITVFADLDEHLTKRVLEEFNKLAEDQKFVMPQIEFEPYSYDNRRKLKRVERYVKRRDTNEKA